MHLLELGERLTCKSARKHDAESGALLLQVAALALPGSVLACLPHLAPARSSLGPSVAPMSPMAPRAVSGAADDGEGDIRENGLGRADVEGGRGQGFDGGGGGAGGGGTGGGDNMQSKAAARMLARTVDRLEVLKENAKVCGISRGTPPGFAHAVVLVLRKLVACAAPEVFRGAAAAGNGSVGGRDGCGRSVEAEWAQEVRRAVRQVLETVEIARVELDDDYVCSGGMDDEDDADEDGDDGGDDRDVCRDAGARLADGLERAAGAGPKTAKTVAEADTDAVVEVAADDADKAMKMRQRSCWLTLRECVLFLSEVSSLALAGISNWNLQGGCGREGGVDGVDGMGGCEGKGSGDTLGGCVGVGQVADQVWPVMTSADFDEVGHSILTGVCVCARARVCAGVRGCNRACIRACSVYAC